MARIENRTAKGKLQKTGNNAATRLLLWVHELRLKPRIDHEETKSAKIFPSSFFALFVSSWLIFIISLPNSATETTMRRSNMASSRALLRPARFLRRSGDDRIHKAALSRAVCPDRRQAARPCGRAKRS